MQNLLYYTIALKKWSNKKRKKSDEVRLKCQRLIFISNQLSWRLRLRTKKYSWFYCSNEFCLPYVQLKNEFNLMDFLKKYIIPGIFLVVPLQFANIFLKLLTVFLPYTISKYYFNKILKQFHFYRHVSTGFSNLYNIKIISKLKKYSPLCRNEIALRYLK